MLHTRCFTRHGCIVGARLVTYQQLEKHYRCNRCGGKITHKTAWDKQREISVDWAECAVCKERDFVSERFFDKQVKDYPLILMALPLRLRALFDREGRRDVTADQAIEELYGF